jgi:hypothetical protein
MEEENNFIWYRVAKQVNDEGRNQHAGYDS